MLIPREFEALLGLQDAMDRTLDTGFFDSATSGRGVHPPVNIFEKDGEIVLVAELPGVKKKDLSIEVKEDTVRLSGERAIAYDKNVNYHRVERNSSKFDRTLKLPINVQTDKVKAEYKDGLLVLFLPRAEKNKPKQITIQ
ncbi:MAG: Hsp20/alpha crystallin family protein [Candidatus Scalindua sp. AMX11]|nr:MAG: Hsp20/alpha crystallin family protein [Candidatus Scalindua sp.]NOG83062.1 Hsp20/alpha crystallin family protein [Planctomycetota bacterium]RZV79541.1 MAG: Hsp20/alpha crystallin family protein [Candidatus Scalindua sp. SCAELEC01]TDE65177.1 MAG: Hsp20/alpha crystallin family protein [Candidatus Scalindua sp. AMX11]GJQ58586.1 MAG: molecular chaperone [Candidatus Scalindua sp.]